MRKVPDKDLFYEIRLPEKSKTALNSARRGSAPNTEREATRSNFGVNNPAMNNLGIVFGEEDIVAETNGIHGVVLDTAGRKRLQNEILGAGMLATEKQKEKVRIQNQCKMIRLGLSGDRLIVRSGGGFLDFIEFL